MDTTTLEDPASTTTANTSSTDQTNTAANTTDNSSTSAAPSNTTNTSNITTDQAKSIVVCDRPTASMIVSGVSGLILIGLGYFAYTKGWIFMSIFSVSAGVFLAANALVNNGARVSYK